MNIEFHVLHQDKYTNARLGMINTPHGSFETPVFMPVGTYGCIKSVSPDDLVEVGVNIILSNTYHLYLRPGHKLIEKFGGLHNFMGWNGPILTDSGGFQVFSLARFRKISDEGIIFQSHLDGSKHFIRPEDAIFIQKSLGADIIMALDECVPYPAEKKYVEISVQRTIAWARRCLEAMKGDRSQSIFGIVQGGVHMDLREKNVKDLIQMDFDGYAIGGLSVGEEKTVRNGIVKNTVSLLPKDKPIYLMGVGMPEDIVEGVLAGVDMFDCVIPTRNGRNGTLFTKQGKIAIKNARYANDNRPIEEECNCYTCRNFTRAYLRHLFMIKELLVYRLNTIHNLYYYSKLMKEIREAISRDKMKEFVEGFYRLRKEENLC